MFWVSLTGREIETKWSLRKQKCTQLGMQGLRAQVWTTRARPQDALTSGQMPGVPSAPAKPEGPWAGGRMARAQQSWSHRTASRS